MAVEIGAILEGKVTGITNFGAFVELPDKSTGMVHISEVSSTFIKDIHEKVSEGDIVKVKVIDINEKGKIMPRRMTGACAKHQRHIAQQIKWARYMALIPYVK